MVMTTGSTVSSPVMKMRPTLRTAHRINFCLI
jgi:hypothetical protein